MAVRAGMANMLLQLRTFCNAGSAEYVVDGITYFTDQQLQDELDQNRQTYYDVYLSPVPRRIGPNTITWLDYNIPAWIGDWFEEDASGSGWQLKDNYSVSITQAGNYTVSYLAKQITLTVDAAGAARFLDCRTYDLYLVAAQIWRQKAALEQRAIDWSSNTVSIHASQRRDHCLEMAKFYDSKAGPHYSRMIRMDEV